MTTLLRKAWLRFKGRNVPSFCTKCRYLDFESMGCPKGECSKLNSEWECRYFEW
ncbi:MAG: hypothetical protein HY280_00575 [Nitrospinae bacterium]|nr:hypothetical protein [Nitrospinota bacterium]